MKTLSDRAAVCVTACEMLAHPELIPELLRLIHALVCEMNAIERHLYWHKGAWHTLAEVEALLERMGKP